MESTGIVRRLDELGRVVIPIEVRRSKDIEDRTKLEIFVDGEDVIIRKYSDSCLFCDSKEDVFQFKGRIICKKCKENLQLSLK